MYDKVLVFPTVLCSHHIPLSSSQGSSGISPFSYILHWSTSIFDRQDRKLFSSADTWFVQAKTRNWVLWLPLWTEVVLWFGELVLPPLSILEADSCSCLLTKFQGNLFLRPMKWDYWRHVEKRAIHYFQNQITLLYWLDLNACQEHCGIPIWNSHSNSQGGINQIKQTLTVVKWVTLTTHVLERVDGSKQI